MAFLFAIRWIALLGLIISAYALYVKRNLAIYKVYKPLCDIKDNVSCSKAFTSKYGSLTGWPNPIFGMIYYVAVFILTLYYDSRSILVLSMIALAGTLYLAYISYFKQKNFCLVCSSIYLINILIFVLSL